MPSTPYDASHRRRREQLLPRAYGTPCPRCGRKMLRGEDLDLGHSEDVALNPAAKGDRIEHAKCNREAGAILGNALRTLRPSRRW
jgi:hypothetical protein